MKEEKKNEKTIKRLTVGTWIVILGLWYIVTKFNITESILIPSPYEVWSTFIDILKNGYNGISLMAHLGISFKRLAIASFLAIVTAIPLGLLSGYFDKIKAIVDSVIQFYRPLPPLAYYTLLILWFGIDDISKITLLYLAAFAPIYISCIAAVSKVNQDYISSAESLGANHKEIFFRIVLPACLPEIFTGIRTAIGVAYTTLVAAEMLAATSGVGWMVIDASRYLKSEVMFVGIIIMGITGIFIDVGLRFLERKLVYWKGYV